MRMTGLLSAGSGLYLCCLSKGWCQANLFDLFGGQPRGRGFTFDVSHLTWMLPGITTAKSCDARTLAGITR